MFFGFFEVEFFLTVEIVVDIIFCAFDETMIGSAFSAGDPSENTASFFPLAAFDSVKSLIVCFKIREIYKLNLPAKFELSIKVPSTTSAMIGTILTNIFVRLLLITFVMKLIINILF